MASRPAVRHCAALVVFASASASAQVPREFSLPQPLFAPSSAWNQAAEAADVLPASHRQILVLYRVLRGDVTDLVPAGEPAPTTWPFPDVTYDEWTIPVFRSAAGTQAVLMCDYDGMPGGNSPKVPVAGDGTVTVPRSAGTVRPSAPQGSFSDGHLVLLDPVSGVEYDFWQATTVRSGPCASLGGGIAGEAILEAGSVDFFDTAGPGTNPDSYSSARAMGTPLLAGLLVPEDVERGHIDHALALAIPGVRNLSSDPSEPTPSEYFYPAATTETDYYSTNPLAIVAGQRLRMRSRLVDDAGRAIDEATELTPITRLFVEAARRYGAYVVDNAGGFTFYAEDVFTADLLLTQDEVRALAGMPADAPLPADRSTWQIVIEALNEDLASIPVAFGPWTAGQDPASATVSVANWEVVAPAVRPDTETP